MRIKPIKNEEDYLSALAQVDKLMDAELNTSQGDKLEVLSILIENYERKHHSIEAPNPVEAIKFRMDQLGLRNVDIAPYMGGANRVSEVLNYKRSLTVEMMRSLKDNLGIPADSLLS